MAALVVPEVPPVLEDPDEAVSDVGEVAFSPLPLLEPLPSPLVPDVPSDVAPLSVELLAGVAAAGELRVSVL